LSSAAASPDSSSSAAAAVAAVSKEEEEEEKEASGVALFARLELAGLALRAAALLWGAAQDALWPRVPYTDADFFVVGEGAALLARGLSPFARATYRYSPLLALLLVPGALLAAALPPALGAPLGALWGKALFCGGDLAAARLTFGLLRRRGLGARAAAWAAAAALLSPLAVNVSSRGSADSLVVALVLLTLDLLFRRRELLAAAALGLATHLRIYPIVYALPLVLFLDEHSAAPAAAAREAARVAAAAARAPAALRPALRPLLALLSPRRAAFALAAGGTFLALGAASAALCGGDYLREALLYHLTRADTRHNFSAAACSRSFRSWAARWRSARCCGATCPSRCSRRRWPSWR